jgi:hypothetical protein
VTKNVIAPRRQARKERPLFISPNLGDLCAFARVKFLPTFSRQDAKYAKAPPPNQFFFAALASISPNLAPFAPLREVILLFVLFLPPRPATFFRLT